MIQCGVEHSGQPDVSTEGAEGETSSADQQTGQEGPRRLDDLEIRSEGLGGDEGSSAPTQGQLLQRVTNCHRPAHLPRQSFPHSSGFEQANHYVRCLSLSPTTTHLPSGGRTSLSAMSTWCENSPPTLFRNALHRSPPISK